MFYETNEQIIRRGLTKNKSCQHYHFFFLKYGFLANKRNAIDIAYKIISIS